MSIGFDPLVGSMLFTAGLIPHASRPKSELECPVREHTFKPFVTVIVALCREKWEDIQITLSSLIQQTYPRDRFEVLIVVEAFDQPILPLARAGLRMLTDAGMQGDIVISNGGKRLKAYALNRAIEQARGNY